MRTALYARKSSESVDRQVQSIDDQISALRSLAERDGVRIDETYVESRSAKDPDTRPEFRRLMEDVESGKVRRIYVWAMNRLSRNLVDGGRVAHLLQTGSLESIRTPEREYLQQDNALIISIENGMAASFIQDLRRNVRRGMDGKVNRGWMPGKPPLGYLNDPISREIVPDPLRFPLVRKAWDSLLTGAHTPINALRLATDLGLTGIARRGAARALSPSACYAMFSNPFYMGRFRYRGRLHAGSHAPMVTEQEFDRAQSLLRRGATTRTRKNEHAYSGLLRCGGCGCRVVAESKSKTFVGTGRKVTYVYYHCTNGKGGCSKRGIREEEVERAFSEAFRSIRLPRCVSEWTLGACLRLAEGEATSTASGLAGIADRVSALERDLDRLHRMRMDGEVTAEEYKGLKERASTELERLNGEKDWEADRDARELRLIREKLLLSVSAEGFEERANAEKRGMALSLGECHLLNQGTIRVSVHPVLQQIAAFEPPEDGSGSPQDGGEVPSNSVWYTLAKNIRTAAREAENGPPAEDPVAALNTIKRYKGTATRDWLHRGNDIGQAPRNRRRIWL